MSKAVIVGATSGIGYEIALILLKNGWELGVAGRRLEKLQKLKALAPDRVHIRVIDVRDKIAAEELSALIDELEGMDLYIHSSGIGCQNVILNGSIELDTTATNVEGFVCMIDAAFSYFAKHGGGHICAITSIAGTRGLGAAAAYSASKRFQNTYLDALEQLSHIRGCCISFTDVRPGFVDTAFLHDGKKYPMMMSPSFVAQKIVEAIDKKKRTVIIDWRYRLLVFFWRLLPQRLWKLLPIRN